MALLPRLFLLLLIPFSGFGQSDKKDFKVLTYNIWNGYDWGKDEIRRAKTQQWINEQNPDVVALQELCNYTDEKLLEDANKWGHNYAVLLKTTGYSVGITSLYPIEIKEKIFSNLHHGALHCKINDIDFLVVHLHPGSIVRRREEAILLTSKIESIKQQNQKYVVLGDFNAHSPFDVDLYKPNDYFLKRLLDENKGSSGNLEHGNLDYSVMSKFLSIPLYDLVQKFAHGIEEKGSFPARALLNMNDENEEQLISRLERIDYIIVSSNLSEKCIKATVHNGQSNWFLSDHYPVSAVFDWNL